MTKRIAVINMKGGVGKSTLCVNLAWHYGAMQKWKKRVLLVDLDPQFNASQYILGVVRYESDIYKAQRPIVWDIFEQASRAPGLRSSGRKLRDAVFPVVQFTMGNYIHLIPSQLELCYTLKNPSQKEHLLSTFLDEIEDQYDLVIIDCAPTESILTTAAYLSSESILIPVKPEFLSTIGLPLIRQSLDDFRKLYKKTVSIVGICFNHSSDYAPEATTSKAEVGGVCAGFGWYVFKEEIPFSRSFPKGSAGGPAHFSHVVRSVARVGQGCRLLRRICGSNCPMTRDTENLVRDLLLLYLRYGPATFAEATEALSRGAVSRDIADGARELSRIAREFPTASLVASHRRSKSGENRSAKKPTSRESTRRYVTNLFSSDNPRDALVAKFVQEIADRIALASPSLLRNYMDSLQLPPMTAHADRYTMAKRIGDFLRGLSAEEAERKIEAGRNMTSPKSSLEAWTNIIVKSDSRG